MKLSEVVEDVVKKSAKKLGDIGKIEIAVKRKNKLAYFLSTTRPSDVKDLALEKGDVVEISLFGEKGKVERRKRF